ncbi:Transcription factor like [Actinidia chinensis var. chinensis]|uniref:Transcription factor like n=1 Tax=Actinidia chinensis var. chinensis TaxID=1590841 RepID=A0A2R6PXR1_ACTCC|nr:Transcription factor like [Actinidia chinensis var. chinensis]
MNSAFEDLSMDEEGNSRGKMGRRRHNVDDEAMIYKSKNLFAERRRRQKLSDRLLELRALMNKATIITDAIAYIEKLQKIVQDLSNQLFEMEATCEEQLETPMDAAEEMKTWGIEPEVKATQIDGTKVWIKIVFEKKKGGFTKLMEAMSVLGYEFTDTSATTSRGAILITACLVVRLNKEQPKKLRVQLDV